MIDGLKKYIKNKLKQLFPCKYEQHYHLKMMNEVQKYINMSESDYPKELKKIYLSKTGNELDFENPKRFTEKIQWRKLYDKNEVYAMLTDKYVVRKWVKDKIGSEYLIPILGVWEKVEDINFDMMPKQFVLKTNNASGTNIIIKDKKTMNKRLVKNTLKHWMEFPFGMSYGFELHYNNIIPLIIAEQYMEPDDGEVALKDYKFYCFDGKPIYCQVISNRSREEYIDFFDMDWNHMDFVGLNPNCTNAPIHKRPQMDKKVFEKMKTLVKKLSSGFSYVRVDLYLINNKIYFGEMTFTPGSGFGNFKPDEWDYKLGDMWDINKSQIDKKVINIL